MPLPKERIYTIDDIYSLPDGERAELINGQIYYMAPPSRKHQEIAMDYYTKLTLYREAGVREYWIVDPLRQIILVYDMEHGDSPAIHSFNDTIPVRIYPGFSIDFSQLNL